MKSGDFRQLMKNYFSFTRSERKGMIVLCLMLLAAMILNKAADYIDFKKPADSKDFISWMEKIKPQESKSENKEMELFAFDPNTISEKSLDSLGIPLQLKRNLIKFRLKGGFFREPDDVKKLYGMNDSLFRIISPWIRIGKKESHFPKVTREKFIFDPNTVTEGEMKSLGFSSLLIRNLTAYRLKGGKFRRKNDLMKVYGMDSLFFKTISDWIAVPAENREEIHKERDIKMIELNRADSVELVAIPGIGPAFASRIIKYRRILGGFYSVEQLLEVYGITTDKLEQFRNYLTVDKSLIIPLRINFADSRTLSMHPYINGQQARAIIEWRSSNGPFPDKNVLFERKIFDLVTFRKAENYLSCQ